MHQYVELLNAEKNEKASVDKARKQERKQAKENAQMTLLDFMGERHISYIKLDERVYLVRKSTVTKPPFNEEFLTQVFSQFTSSGATDPNEFGPFAIGLQKANGVDKQTLDLATRAPVKAQLREYMARQ
jgi:hypothetical protein